MPDITSGLGPLLGPDFIEVVANDETGMQYTLQVFPDANNPALKAAGLPQQFYFQPQRVYLAKKQNSPADYDFGMTVFKGLMTQETTIGVTDAETTDGSVEAGGGFCSFTTTFGIPDSVIANAITRAQVGRPPGARATHREPVRLHRQRARPRGSASSRSPRTTSCSRCPIS